MSENNKQQKIFVPGTSVKEFKFNDGGSVLRLSINLEKFAPFVKEHKNENGYINFNINPRRDIGQFGDTHSVSLDTWKPTKTKSETAPKKSAKPVEKKTSKAVEPEEAPDFV